MVICGLTLHLLGALEAIPALSSKPTWVAIDLVVNPLETRVQSQSVWSSERNWESSQATSQQPDNESEPATAVSATNQKRPARQCSAEPNLHNAQEE